LSRLPLAPLFTTFRFLRELRAKPHVFDGHVTLIKLIAAGYDNGGCATTIAFSIAGRCRRSPTYNSALYPRTEIADHRLVLSEELGSMTVTTTGQWRIGDRACKRLQARSASGPTMLAPVAGIFGQ